MKIAKRRLSKIFGVQCEKKHPTKCKMVTRDANNKVNEVGVIVLNVDEKAQVNKSKISN